MRMMNIIRAATSAANSYEKINGLVNLMPGKNMRSVSVVLVATTIPTIINPSHLIFNEE